MTYEELSPEIKAKFDALMQAGETQRALSLLKQPRVFTPEEQAAIDRKVANMEKRNKRFSKFVSAVFVLAACYLIWETLLK